MTLDEAIAHVMAEVQRCSGSMGESQAFELIDALESELGVLRDAIERDLEDELNDDTP